MHEIRSFVIDSVYVCAKVVLSSSKGCLMVSNKEDVQNNMKKNGRLCRTWSGPVLEYVTSAVLMALTE